MLSSDICVMLNFNITHAFKAQGFVVLQSPHAVRFPPLLLPLHHWASHKDGSEIYVSLPPHILSQIWKLGVYIRNAYVLQSGFIPLNS